MALKLSGVTTYGKTDVFRFDPRELVTRFAAYTGRKHRSDEAVERMAASLLLNGQEQAFLYRKGEDGGPVPVSGHTRILAAAKITNESMGMYSPDTPFLLRGEFRQMNEAEAMFHTFAENDEDSRTPLSPLDIAYFIRTVSETMGLSDADIAKKMGKNPNYVSRHRKVLDLDHNTQKAVADGKVKLDAVVNTLHKLTPEKRAEAIAKANGSGPSIAKAAREAGATAPRTDADFKGWMRHTAEKMPARGRAFLLGILEYRAGKISGEELEEMLRKLVG